MGKPKYLHRKNQADKKFLNLLALCRQLKRTNQMTLDNLCFWHFGENGAITKSKMRMLLKKVFFVLWDKENICFGPTHMIGDPMSAFYYHVATQPWEKAQMLNRYIGLAGGVLRRVIGDDKHENIPLNWMAALGTPVADFLLGHPTFSEIGGLLQSGKNK